MLLRSISHGDLTDAQEILRETIRRRRPHGRAKQREPIPLTEACPGLEQTAPTSPGPTRYWSVRRTLDEVAPDRLPADRRYAAILRGAGQQFDELEASPALCHAANAGPEDMLFLDIETCGLGSMPIFLIGLMLYADGHLTFDQFFARDYSEEAGILQAFSERVTEAGVLVTFNGKAFDLIRQRSAVLSVMLPDRLPPHLDLRQESRRRWRGEVPNFKLQTLERHLFGRRRPSDIPAPQIPDVYHEFVRSGDARRIGDILHHNLLDLLTMGDLLCAILTGRDPVVE